MGAKCEVSYERGYDSVINDEALTDTAREVIADWFGQDFSAFTEAAGCPGVFVEIGTRNEEKGTTRPHHNTTYLMDEDGLYYGTAFFAAMIEKKMM